MDKGWSSGCFFTLFEQVEDVATVDFKFYVEVITKAFLDILSTLLKQADL